MKKLMIAAAIVCAAALSQAATCYWNVQNAAGKYISTMGGDYDGEFSGMALIFDAQTYDQETMWNSIFDGSKTIADYTPAKELTITDGKFGVSFTTDWTENTKQSFFLVAVDGDNYMFSESFGAKASTLPSGASINVNASYESGDPDTVFGNVAYTGDGGWYSVPEPTSGLLLLLGVAGLALRRRRA